MHVATHALPADQPLPAQMEVARAPGGFLMPHQMYHERQPAAATGGGPGPRRIRIMRTAPHEFYDGTMAATPSVDVDGDDAAPASFTAWFPSGRFGGVPAAASAVADLPETTVTTGGDGEETCCAVCLEGCVAGDALRTVPCAHTFHEDASWTGSPSAASARWRRRTPPANTHRRKPGIDDDSRSLSR